MYPNGFRGLAKNVTDERPFLANPFGGEKDERAYRIFEERCVQGSQQTGRQILDEFVKVKEYPERRADRLLGRNGKGCSKQKW